MPVTTSVDNDMQLTIHTVTGEASFEEGMTTLKQFFEVRPTKYVLWDFRKGSLAHVSYKDTEAMMDYIKHHSEKRSGGKTAFVVSRDLEYGLSRMAQTLAEIKNLSIQMEIFRSFKEAIRWFGEEE
jgi:hypothetical protein